MPLKGYIDHEGNEVLRDDTYGPPLAEIVDRFPNDDYSTLVKHLVGGIAKAVKNGRPIPLEIIGDLRTACDDARCRIPRKLRKRCREALAMLTDEN